MNEILGLTAGKTNNKKHGMPVGVGRIMMEDQCSALFFKQFF